MKLFKTRMMIFTSLLLASLAQAAPSLSLTPFAATYDLYSKGLKVAYIERTFKALPDGTYVYESYSETAGVLALFRDDVITERSHWRLTDNGYQPIEYHYLHSGSDEHREVDINFDWNNKQVHMRVNEDHWQMDLEPGTLDKMLYQLAVMRDLKRGIRELTYRIADGGQMKSYDFESFGHESVETPYGKFKALKVERFRDDRERETRLWCVEELDYLPVKVVNIEPDGLKTTALLQSYKTLPQGYSSAAGSTAGSTVGLNH